jgi:hypothetical protein
MRNANRRRRSSTTKTAKADNKGSETPPKKPSVEGNAKIGQSPDL